MCILYSFFLLTSLFIHHFIYILSFIFSLFFSLFLSLFSSFFAFSGFAEVACLCLCYAVYSQWLRCVCAASAEKVFFILSRRRAQRASLFFFCVRLSVVSFFHNAQWRRHTHTRDIGSHSAGSTCSACKRTDTSHTHSTRRNTAAPLHRGMNATVVDARETHTHTHTHTLAQHSQES